MQRLSNLNALKVNLLSVGTDSFSVVFIVGSWLKSNILYTKAVTLIAVCPEAYRNNMHSYV
jgi:hypothetical protein